MASSYQSVPQGYGTYGSGNSHAVPYSGINGAAGTYQHELLNGNWSAQQPQKYEYTATEHSGAASASEVPLNMSAPATTPRCLTTWQRWQPSFLMSSLLLLGTGTAIAHHFGYAYLDGKSVDIFDELWARNIAAAAAFVVKVAFCMTVGLAFQEVLWHSLRKRLTKIGTIDKLFTLQSNPLSFLTADGLKTAPVAVILAGVAWCIPIIAIVTPSTLGVGNLTTFGTVPCSIPVFEGSIGTTHLFQTDGATNAYSGASLEVKKVADQTVPNGNVLPFTSPCGQNCTFVSEFFAPALRCEDRPPPDMSDAKSWIYYDAQVSTEDGSPMALGITYNNWYSSNKTVAEKAEVTDPGTFRTLICTPYNATYHLLANYSNSNPTYTTTIKTYHDPIPVLPSALAMRPDACGDNCAAVNFVSILDALYDYLTGTVENTPSSSTPSTTSKIQSTSLVAANSTSDIPWVVSQDLYTGIPSLLSNLTISTLSFSTTKEQSTCAANGTRTAYTYNPRWLVLPYAIALGLVLLSLVLGTLALRETGASPGDVFSQVLVTTRNERLDEICKGLQGSSKYADELKRERVVLGVIGDRRKMDGRLGFGLEGQVNRVRGRK